MLGMGARSRRPPWVEEHGASRRCPTSSAAPLAGQAGLGAVRAGRARVCRDALAEPAGSPGRPDRPGVQCHRRGLRPGGGERGHRGGAARRPPAPPAGGLAAAGSWPVVRLRVCQLGAAGLAGGAGRRRPRGPGRQRAGDPGLDRLRVAVDPDRVVALSALALVGQGRGNRAAAGVGVVGAGPVQGIRSAGRQPAGG
jgi:hypothetical protein